MFFERFEKKFINDRQMLWTTQLEYCESHLSNDKQGGDPDLGVL